MSSDFAIRLSNASKRYLIYDRPEHRLMQMVMPRLARLAGRPEPTFFRVFPAVEPISFEVGRGETVGIVGRNGSGKSTLLQMICGTLQPSSGTVEVKGRIAALLELGSGFNPEFTGRENVFMNAAILGLSREETAARFDAIASFADIGPFIDQPVKTYSSGMFVRLAFAVATSVDPDILIVDEALSVGDEAFQRKCFARIEDIKARGGTILFVSHGAQTIVQLCDRAILIDRGEKILEGPPKSVISHYQRLMNLSGDQAEAVREDIKTLDGWAETEEASDLDRPIQRVAAAGDSGPKPWFDQSLISMSRVEFERKGAQICDVHIVDEAGEKVNHLILNERYRFVYKVSFQSSFNAVNFAMFVKTIQGVELAGQHAFPFDAGIDVEAQETVQVSLPFVCLFLPGVYSCNCGVFVGRGGHFELLHRVLDELLFRVLPADPKYSRYGFIDLCPEDTSASVKRLTAVPAP